MQSSVEGLTVFQALGPARLLASQLLQPISLDQ